MTQAGASDSRHFLISMNEKNIRVEHLPTGVALVNPYYYRISEFYTARGADYVSAPHRLNFSALVYITEGDGVHYIDHQRYVLRPRTLLTLGRSQVHSFAKERTVEGMVLPFNCNLLSCGDNDPYFELMLAALAQNNCFNHIDDDVHCLLSTLAAEYYSTSPFKVDTIRSLLRAIMFKLVLPATTAAQPLSLSTGRNCDFFRLKQYIEQHFEARPTATTIAQALGKSPKQLDKIARENSGHSVKALLDDRVLLEVKRLLAFSHFSVAEIADKLGFNEASNMTKFFKRHTDINPKDFRQLCRMGLCRQ